MFFAIQKTSVIYVFVICIIKQNVVSRCCSHILDWLEEQPPWNLVWKGQIRSLENKSEPNWGWKELHRFRPGPVSFIPFYSDKSQKSQLQGLQFIWIWLWTSIFDKRKKLINYFTRFSKQFNLIRSLNYLTSSRAFFFFILGSRLFVTISRARLCKVSKLGKTLFTLVIHSVILTWKSGHILGIQN